MLRIIRSGLEDKDAALPDVLPPMLKGAEAAEDPRAARRRARQR
jgi:hypothetical protein